MKFKLGDRVRVNSPMDRNKDNMATFYDGKSGTVVFMDHYEDFPYIVNFVRPDGTYPEPMRECRFAEAELVDI